MYNFYKKAIWTIALVMGLYGSNSQAQFIAPYLTAVEYNTDVDYHTAFDIDFNDVVLHDIAFGVFSNVTPAIISSVRNAVVDGYHKDSSGLKYFSFDVDTRVNGVSVLKSDIIRCVDLACLNFVFVFDADMHNLRHLNINAFTYDPVNNDLIFSLESDARISGILYLAADLIRFDGTNFSLAYDSTSQTFARYQNIDGLSKTNNGRYLVSLANNGQFKDVYEYNLTTAVWGVAYKPFNNSNSKNHLNMSSLMITIQPAPDLIFRDDFE